MNAVVDVQWTTLETPTCFLSFENFFFSFRILLSLNVWHRWCKSVYYYILTCGPSTSWATCAFFVRIKRRVIQRDRPKQSFTSSLLVSVCSSSEACLTTKTATLCCLQCVKSQPAARWFNKFTKHIEARKNYLPATGLVLGYLSEACMHVCASEMWTILAKT